MFIVRQHTQHNGHFLVIPIDMELADSRGIEPLFVGWQPTVLTFGRTIHLGGFRPHLEVLVWVVAIVGLEPTLSDLAQKGLEPLPCELSQAPCLSVISPYLNLVYILYHIRLSLSSVFQHFFNFFVRFRLWVFVDPITHRKRYKLCECLTRSHIGTIAFATAFLTSEAFATALIPLQHRLSLGI